MMPLDVAVVGFWFLLMLGLMVYLFSNHEDR